MKILRLSALAIALAASVGQANAGNIAFGDDWGFNPLGTGVGAAIMPIDEMTYLGISYTESTGVSAGDTFADVGRLGASSFQNDGSLIPAGVSGLGVGYEMSGTFEDWTGTYGATTGTNTAFTFDAGGTLDIQIDTVFNNTTFAGARDGINIMSLEIITGTGNINFGNPAGVDGNVDILFEVTSAAAGYWFLDLNDDGVAETDISTLLGGPNPIALGLTDSNNNILIPAAAVAADFIAETGLGTPNGLGDIYTTNDGSFTIGKVPEPSTIALFGSSLLLLGVGVRTRRRKS